MSLLNFNIRKIQKGGMNCETGLDFIKNKNCQTKVDDRNNKLKIEGEYFTASQIDQNTFMQLQKSKYEYKICKLTTENRLELMNKSYNPNENYKKYMIINHKNSTDQPKLENKIKVMTYNINSFNINKSKNQKNIEELIKKENPDILSVQEAYWNLNLNSIYDKVVSQQKYKYYSTQIFFKKDLFKKLQHNKYNFNRGITCLKLRHKISNQVIIIIAFHFDHFYNSSLKGSNTITKTIGYFKKILDDIQFNNDSHHLILLGDSNEFYERFLKYRNNNLYNFPLKWRSNTYEIWFKDGGPTCCSNSGRRLKHISDIIGTNNKDQLLNLKIGSKWGDKYSDHVYVTATYSLQNVKKSNEEVWAYDFDGVVHTLMQSDQNFKTSHRGPDYNHRDFKDFETKYWRLKQYLFPHTIKDMKRGQKKGVKIIIVSANSKRYRTSIYHLLRNQNIDINTWDIHMKAFPKVQKLENENVTKFVDDSCANIKKIYKAKNNGKLPKLKQLIFAIPEDKDYYNVDLNQKLELCNTSDWDKLLKKNNLPGVTKLT